MIGEESLCWICFSEEGQDKTNNPFLISCKCQGETQYAHLNCLKEWLTTSGRPKCLICDSSYVVPFEYEKEVLIPHSYYLELILLVIVVMIILYPLGYLIYKILLKIKFIFLRCKLLKEKIRESKIVKTIKS